jgi:hypothetical protein
MPLADAGIYIASEASFYRVLRAHGQINRRGRAQPPRTSRPPTTHIAARPGEVWCWDLTFLPTQIRGRWFYFYLILDLFSRKIVGFEVHDTDSVDHAAHLARRTALAEGVHADCEEDEAQTLHPKRVGAPDVMAGQGPAIAHEVLRSPGQPLTSRPTNCKTSLIWSLMRAMPGRTTTRRLRKIACSTKSSALPTPFSGSDRWRATVGHRNGACARRR